MQKSCLIDVIADISQSLKETAKCTSMGEFIDLCIGYYGKVISAYYTLFEASVYYASGQADEEQITLASRVNTVVEESDYIYGKSRSNKPRYDGKKDTIRIQDPITLLIFEYCRMRRMHKTIKICKNCGTYFIPEKRATVTIFCQKCRKNGPQLKKSKAIKESEFEASHRKSMNYLNRQIKIAQENYDPKNKDDREILMGFIDKREKEMINFREAKKEHKNE